MSSCYGYLFHSCQLITRSENKMGRTIFMYRTKISSIIGWHPTCEVSTWEIPDPPLLLVILPMTFYMTVKCTGRTGWWEFFSDLNNPGGPALRHFHVSFYYQVLLGRNNTTRRWRSSVTRKINEKLQTKTIRVSLRQGSSSWRDNRRLCTRFDPDFVLASNLSANLEM